MLAAQFKAVFAQLHAASPDGTRTRAQALPQVLREQITPLLSGLKDFQASFGGDFTHHDARGRLNEAGHAEYRFSQKTTLQRNAASGDMTVTQVRNAHLEASYKKARAGLTLEVASGNHDGYRIADTSVVTTSITSVKDSLTRAVKTRLLQRSLVCEKFVDHHLVDRRETPFTQRLAQDLLLPAAAARPPQLRPARPPVPIPS